jgi:hypothetical protein
MGKHSSEPTILGLRGKQLSHQASITPYHFGIHQEKMHFARALMATMQKANIKCMLVYVKQFV